MELTNRGWERSLACLQHPAALIAIAILLLNDHLLKAVAPSWFTGKLSDFAGLFFFPFIVAATLSLLLAKARLSVRQAGVLAFALVAASFLLLKISPLSNALAAQVMSRLLGRPAAFVLDPTDLIALAGLLPAWRLWNTPRVSRPRSLAYASLLVGAVAAMATSPALPPASVEFFASDAHAVYASAESYWRYQSVDAGKTWTQCTNNDCREVPSLDKRRRLPITVCDTTSPQLCFRITGNPTIEQSADGGKSWFVSWQYPPARLPYLGRGGGSPKLADITPRDLIILPAPPSTVLVAMGEAGVLRRALPDGVWEKPSITYAAHITYTSLDYVSGIFDTAGELALWIMISATMTIFCGLVLWTSFKPRRISTARLASWMFATALSAAVFIGVAAWLLVQSLLLLAWSNPFDLPDWMETADFVFGAATVIIYGAFFLSIQGNIQSLVAKLVEDAGLQRSLLLVLFSMVVANSVAALIIWPYWALGIIWDYRVALALAIASSALILFGGGWLIHRKIAQYEAEGPNKIATA